MVKALTKPFRLFWRACEKEPMLLAFVTAITLVCGYLCVAIIGLVLTDPPKGPLPATLPNAIAVLEAEAAQARVIVTPEQPPLIASDTGLPTRQDQVMAFYRADIVAMAADLGLSAKPGSECATQDGIQICLEEIAGDPVLTLRRP